jgi:hypothetical protein
MGLSLTPGLSVGTGLSYSSYLSIVSGLSDVPSAPVTVTPDIYSILGGAALGQVALGDDSDAFGLGPIPPSTMGVPYGLLLLLTKPI